LLCRLRLSVFLAAQDARLTERYGASSESACIGERIIMKRITPSVREDHFEFIEQVQAEATEDISDAEAARRVFDLAMEADARLEQRDAEVKRLEAELERAEARADELRSKFTAMTDRIDASNELVQFTEEQRELENTREERERRRENRERRRDRIRQANILKRTWWKVVGEPDFETADG
jgi:chromosome segregation ATPase